MFFNKNGASSLREKYFFFQKNSEDLSFLACSYEDPLVLVSCSFLVENGRKPGGLQGDVCMMQETILRTNCTRIPQHEALVGRNCY